ncbi:glycosyltransferase [Pseudoalteromonas sp. D15MCD-2]|uniref:glycosyltransferase n=1 Tax=Pseudoalteromonas sp. D15MCD-2 TaxID=3138933 RepID=UPI0031581B39
MKNKRIAILSPVNPFTYDSGARIRIFEISKGVTKFFTEQGIAVDFIYLDDVNCNSYERAQAFEQCNLISFKLNRSRLSSLFRMVVLFNSYRASKFFSRELKCFLSINKNKYDAFYVNFFDMLGHFDFKKNTFDNIVVDTHNDDYLWYESFEKKSLVYKLYGKLNKFLFLRENKERARKLNFTINVSDNDTDSLNNRLSVRGYTAPNGIVERYSVPKKVGTKDNISILFCASLSVTMNVDAITWFVKNVLPLLNAKEPKFSLKIVGRNPSNAVKALANEDTVELYANVDSIDNYYEQSDIVVLPFKLGGGSKLKLLEALSFQVPVVTSNVGLIGCENLSPFVHAEDLVPDLFAKKIFEVVDTYKQVVEVSGDAKSYIDDNFSWSSISVELAKKLNNEWRLCGS